jgi:hypothetical protein
VGLAGPGLRRTVIRGVAEPDIAVAVVVTDVTHHAADVREIVAGVHVRPQLPGLRAGMMHSKSAQRPAYRAPGARASRGAAQ